MQTCLNSRRARTWNKSRSAQHKHAQISSWQLPNKIKQRHWWWVMMGHGWSILIPAASLQESYRSEGNPAASPCHASCDHPIPGEGRKLTRDDECCHVSYCSRTLINLNHPKNRTGKASICACSRYFELMESNTCLFLPSLSTSQTY